MLKSIKKIFIATLAVFSMTTVFIGVAQAGNIDSSSPGICQRGTASGNNRSGTCSLARGTGRGTTGWSHQQFNLSTSGSGVNNAAGSMFITVSNGVTSANTATIRPGGGSTTVSRGRVAFMRSLSGGMLNN